MATIISQPTSPCFTSLLTDVTFACADESATLTISFGEEEVVEETVYPGIDGSVVVSELRELAEIYVKRYLQCDMVIKLKDSTGTATVSCTLIYCIADMDLTTSAFCSNHFLTILNGEKVTALGRAERLYAHGVGTVSVSALALDDEGKMQDASFTLAAVSTTRDVSQFDVSPSVVQQHVAGKLVWYVVTAGSRRQEFSLVDDKVAPAPSLIFTNSFGCQEFIHCVGKHVKSSKYNRSSMRIRGKLHNYKIEEDRQFQGNTGFLNVAMADWADDLFRSEEVYLWVDGHVGKEVAISESKSEISNEDDDMPAFEFTYGYAQRNANVMQVRHAGRIFDNTFDRTFE